MVSDIQIYRHTGLCSCNFGWRRWVADIPLASAGRPAAVWARLGCWLCWSLQPPPRLGPTQVLAGIGVGFALISEALACSFQDFDAACHPLAALRGAVLTVLLSLPGVVYFTRLYLPFPTSARQEDSPALQRHQYALSELLLYQRKLCITEGKKRGRQ